MTPDIHDTPMTATLLGASGRFAPNDGFGHDGEVFAGVETQVPDAAAIGLERFELRLDRYAEWTHVGPYSKLGQTYDAMHKAVTTMAYRPTRPLVEIYGHWTDDESKLETRILWSIV